MRVDDFEIIQITDSTIDYAYIELTCDSGKVVDSSFDREYIYEISNDTLFIDNRWAYECRKDIYVGSTETVMGEWDWIGMVYEDSCDGDNRNLMAGEAGFTKTLTITPDKIIETVIYTYDCYTEDVEEFLIYWSQSYTAIDCDTYSIEEDVITATTHGGGLFEQSSITTYEYEGAECVDSLGWTETAKATPEYCVEIEDAQEEFRSCMSTMCMSIYNESQNGMAQICRRTDISDRRL